MTLALLLESSDCVCFDVDSTVIAEESIDSLADFLGVGDEVKLLTERAMHGEKKFEDTLRSRLDIMQPSKSCIAQFMKLHHFQFTDGVEDLVEKLLQMGKAVYLVSGGFRVMIDPLAKLLRIPLSRVYANTIIFDDSGLYAGFDENELTSRDRGKPDVLTNLIKENGFKCVVMIGDGATDMQASPPAAAFIGYGGIVERRPVKEGATYFVYNFKELLDLI